VVINVKTFYFGGIGDMVSEFLDVPSECESTCT